MIRIPHFCFVASTNIFNVSCQQLEVSKSVIYRELDDFFPTRLQYVCQGVNTRQWIRCTNSQLANLISETLGDHDEWLHDAESLMQLRPWKSDDTFLSKFQRVKLLNKALLMEQIIESVKETKYENVPNQNYAMGVEASQYITQKRVIYDDVNSFFSNFLQIAKQDSTVVQKQDDLMIQLISIDNELLITKDEQLYKLLSFTFMIIYNLIQSIASTNSEQPAEAVQSPVSDKEKVLYIIKITQTLDPNLKYFLNSLKTALLKRTINMRLVIIEGEKIIAAQNGVGKKVEGSISSQIYQFTDLAHFMTPFQYENQVKFLMNGGLLLCHKQSSNIEILQRIRAHNLFSYGSGYKKQNAFKSFLKAQREQLIDGESNPHIPPQLMQVYNFMKKYQEQEALQGFKYVINEILKKQVFAAQNVKLTAMLTLDFPEYLQTCKYAQQRFFAEQFTVPSASALKTFEKRRSMQ